MGFDANRRVIHCTLSRSSMASVLKLSRKPMESMTQISFTKVFSLFCGLSTSISVQYTSSMIIYDLLLEDVPSNSVGSCTALVITLITVTSSGRRPHLSSGGYCCQGFFRFYKRHGDGGLILICKTAGSHQPVVSVEVRKFAVHIVYKARTPTCL